MISVGLVALGLAYPAFGENDSMPPADNYTPLAGPMIIPGKKLSPAEGVHSAAVDELLAMLDAKIDTSVILAFISNSPIPYEPSGNELIALTEHGASVDLLLAILRHGDELRFRQASDQTAVSLQPGPATPYDAMASQEPPSTSSDSAAPEEGIYPPTYYAYSYWWPWLCQTPVRNDYRPYLYHHGCWNPPGGHDKHAAAGGHFAVVASSVPRAVSTPNASHTRSVPGPAGARSRSTAPSSAKSR